MARPQPGLLLLRMQNDSVTFHTPHCRSLLFQTIFSPRAVVGGSHGAPSAAGNEGGDTGLSLTGSGFGRQVGEGNRIEVRGSAAGGGGGWLSRNQADETHSGSESIEGGPSHSPILMQNSGPLKSSSSLASWWGR